MKKNAYLILLLTMMAVLWGGCKHDHDEHDEHHVTLQLAAYTDQLELYVETHPLVVGEETELLCHLTRLDNFKPVEEGAATLTANIAGKTITLRNDKPEQPGIYRFTLTPEKAGKAKLSLNFRNKRVDATMHLGDLQVFEDEEEAHEDAEKREVKSANGVKFSKEMSWGVDFATEPASRMPIGTIIRATAQIQRAQGDEVVLSAKVDGVVTLAKTSLSLGANIKAGQSICSIDASQVADNNLRAEQQKAATELKRAKAEYERLKELRNDQLALESELQNAKAAYESTQAANKALQEGFKGGGQTVTATRGGYLKQLCVQNGQFVTAGQTIAVITQSRTMQLRAEIQASYYPEMNNVCGATIRAIDNGNPNAQVWTLEELNGKLLSYGRQTGEGAPLLPVIFELDNVLDMLPGTYVEMFIRTSSADTKTVVPAAAVLEEMGNYFVYVQLTPELFEKRQVHIGQTDGLHTEVKDGLQAGDRVVSRGAIIVKMQQAAGGVDAHSGHQH